MKTYLLAMAIMTLPWVKSCSADSEINSDPFGISEEEALVEERKKAADSVATPSNPVEQDSTQIESIPTESETGSEELPGVEPEVVPAPIPSNKSVEDIMIFPPDHPINIDISGHPVDANSALIINNIGADVGIFADFGSGTYKGAPIGIPYAVVGNDQPKVPITYRANSNSGNYGHQSEPGPMPIPLNAPVEGDFIQDWHAIAVDIDNGMLYELFNAEQVGDGWEASSAAVFNLNTTEYRPDGWTSADAAGLPIFPLLLRHKEIERGEIDHAIRFTLQRDKIYEGYVHPARHQVSGQKTPELLPFGGRLRLRADFDISSYSQENQVILRALKKHGLMLADVGVNMYLKGEPNENWNNTDLRELRNVKVSDFEVVELGEIKSSN
ncbi:MAG: hypothetical protein WBM83_02810 [Flavobacteriaceae bacterium]